MVQRKENGNKWEHMRNWGKPRPFVPCRSWPQWQYAPKAVIPQKHTPLVQKRAGETSTTRVRAHAMNYTKGKCPHTLILPSEPRHGVQYGTPSIAISDETAAKGITPRVRSEGGNPHWDFKLDMLEVWILVVQLALAKTTPPLHYSTASAAAEFRWRLSL